MGARIYYVIFELEYFLNNKKELLNIKNGGIAIYGGVIFFVSFSFIFLYSFYKYRKK
ncbi:MAG TPA: prolipoprotein diacylglyceryl transferase [Clostridia bacterium]|nr:prolipoprotein diacylglyceryl transferase [Clostridia bacterium]